MGVRNHGVDTRWATREDGDIVAHLAKAVGFTFPGVELDWSTLAPYWLVGELDGQIVGALQVLIAYPVSRIDHMMIDPDLTNRERYCVIEAMTGHGELALGMMGCSLVSTSIDTDRGDASLRMAERRRWVDSGTVHHLWKRIR